LESPDLSQRNTVGWDVWRERWIVRIEHIKLDVFREIDCYDASFAKVKSFSTLYASFVSKTLKE